MSDLDREDRRGIRLLGEGSDLSDLFDMPKVPDGFMVTVLVAAKTSLEEKPIK